MKKNAQKYCRYELWSLADIGKRQGDVMKLAHGKEAPVV